MEEKSSEFFDPYDTDFTDPYASQSDADEDGYDYSYLDSIAPSKSASPVLIDEPAGDFKSGWDAGVESLQSLAYGAMAAAGKATGNDDWLNSGLTGMKVHSDNAAKFSEGRVTRIEDAEGIGDYIDYAQYTLGQLGPFALESAAGAIAGGFAGSTVPGVGTVTAATVGLFSKKAVKEAVKLYVKGELKDTAEDVAKAKVAKLALKRYGATAGSTLASYPIAVGDVFNETVEVGADGGLGDAGTAFGVAIPYAALDVLPEAGIIRKVLSPGKSSSRIKQVGRSFVTQAPKESLAETGQEELLIRTHAAFDPNYDTNGDEANSRRLNSAVGGALGGGAASLLTGIPAPLKPEAYHPTHTLSDGTEVMQHSEDGIPSPGMYQQKDGKIVRADDARPLPIDLKTNKPASTDEEVNAGNLGPRVPFEDLANVTEDGVVVRPEFEGLSGVSNESNPSQSAPIAPEFSTSTQGIINSNRAAAEAVPAAEPETRLLPTREPDPLVVFPDGTTGYQSDIDSYLTGLESTGKTEEAAAFRARLLGYAGEVGRPAEAVPESDLEGFTLENPDVNTRKGTPFKTEKSAIMAIKSQKLSGYEAVAVNNGFTARFSEPTAPVETTEAVSATPQSQGFAPDINEDPSPIAERAKLVPSDDIIAAVEYLASEVQANGGGMGLVGGRFDEGADNIASDQLGDVRRLPSTNPAWFKDNNFTKKQADDVVKRLKEGKKVNNAIYRAMLAEIAEVDDAARFNELESRAVPVEPELSSEQEEEIFSSLLEKAKVAGVDLASMKITGNIREESSELRRLLSERSNKEDGASNERAADSGRVQGNARTQAEGNEAPSRASGVGEKTPSRNRGVEEDATEITETIPPTGGVSTSGVDKRTARRQSNAVAGDERRQGDRRQDSDLRKRIDEMTPAEMQVALLTDDLTGLANKRAYEESDKKPVQVFIDLDGLKYINDEFGHDQGDVFLSEFGVVVAKVTSDGYHVSGDEFVIQAETNEKAKEIVDKVYALSADLEFEFESKGKITNINGIGFSYGQAGTLKEADSHLQKHKQERTDQGLRGNRGDSNAGATGSANEVSAEGKQSNAQDQKGAKDTDLLGDNTTKAQARLDTELAEKQTQADKEDAADSYQGEPDLLDGGKLAPDLFEGESQGATGIAARMRKNAASTLDNFGGKSLSPAAVDYVELVLSTGRKTTKAEEKEIAEKHGISPEVVRLFEGNAGFGFGLLDQKSLDGDVEAKAIRQKAIDKAADTGLNTQKSTVMPRYAELGTEPASAIQAIEDAENITGLHLNLRITESSDLPPHTPARINLGTLDIEFNTVSPIGRGEAAQYVAEELLHAMDVLPGNKTISASSARLDVNNGDIFQEATDHLSEGGEFSEFLSYPLKDEWMADHRKQAGLFARLGVLYFGNNQQMQRDLPLAYEVYHEVFQLTELPVGSERISKQVWSNSRRNTEDGSSVQGESSSGRSKDLASRDESGYPSLGAGVERSRAELASAIGGSSLGRKANLGGLDSKYLNTDNSSLYSGYERTNNTLREPVSPADSSDEGQLNLFTASDIPSEVAKDQAADNFAVRYNQVPVGEIRTGVTRVTSNEEAAHVLAGIRKHGQETAMALVADEDGNILNVIRHSKGGKGSAVFIPGDLAAAVAATDNASTVWFAHNHPSGSSKASDADKAATRAIVAALDGAGINTAGHLIFPSGSSTATFLNEDGNEVDGVKIKPMIRKRTVSITERMIRRRGDMGIQELTRAEETIPAIESLDSDNGVLLLNNRHRPIGVISMSQTEMSKLRDGRQVRRILNAIDTTNASAAVVFEKNGDSGAALNVGNYLARVGLRVIDAIVEGKSQASMGRDVGLSTEPFFSKHSKSGVNSKPEGMTTSQVRSVIDRFKKAFNGVENLDFIVVENKESAFSPADLEKYKGETIKGAYYPARGSDGRGKILLIASDLDSAADAFATLQHEIVTHFGLDTLTEKGKKDVIDLVKGTRGNKDWVDLWSSIDKDYHDKNEDVRAEELIARVTEQSLLGGQSAIGRAWDSLVQWITKALRKVGLITRPMKKSELDRLIRVLAGRVRSGERQRILPLDSNPKTSQTGQAPVSSSRAIEFSGDEFGSFSGIGDLKIKVRSWARKSLAGKTVVNESDGESIVITWSGIKKDTAKATKDKLVTLYKLEEMLAKSNYLGFEADPAARAQVSGMHTYAVPVNINGEAANVTLYVRETEGRRFYDHHVEKKAKPEPPGTIPRANLQGGSDSGLSSGSRESIADELINLDDPDIRLSRVKRPYAPDQRSKETHESNSIWKTINNRLDPIRYQMQDKLIDLKRHQQEIENSGAVIPDNENAYQKASIWESKAGEALADFDEDRVQPLLQQIADSGKTVTEVGEWLVARHAKEANAYLSEINPDRDSGERFSLSGMSNAEADIILRDNDSNEILQEIGESVDQINRDRVELLVARGLSSREETDAWQGRYDHYVPLMREEMDENMPARGSGFHIRGKESKMRTGSTLNPEHIISNTLAQYEASIVRAEKNEVGKALLELVEQNPDESFWSILTKRTQSVVRNGKVVESGKVFDADNELSVKRDGKEYIIEFNAKNEGSKRLAGGLKNLDAREMNKVLRVMAGANRFLSSINTTYNPEFVISNFSRDIQTAAYNLSGTELENAEAKVLKSVPKAMNGIRNAIFGDGKSEWAAVYEDFRQAGGKTGWIDLHSNIESHEKTLEKAISQLKKGKPTRSKFKRFIDAINDANTIVENGVRLSAYKAALDAGLSKDKAAALAKDLTVNFNRKGASGPLLNALYMFYNASVQGSTRLMQTLINSKKGRKLAIGTIGFAVMLDILNRSLSDDDDDGENIYDALPDYVKDHNLIVMGATEPLIKIPLPWGYNVLHVMGQSIGKAVGSDRFNAMDAMGRVGLSVVESFNPVGSGTIGQTIAPTLLDPLVMSLENKNFAGNPLKPEQIPFGPQKPAYLQHWASASSEGKMIAKFLNDVSGGDSIEPGIINVSPEILEMVFEQATGGAGRFISRTADLAIDLSTGEEIKTNNIPFLRRVTGYENEWSLKRRYYDWSEKIAYQKKRLKGLTGAELVEARKRRETKLVGLYNLTQKRLRVLRKNRKKLISKDGDTERVDTQIRKMMARFNKAYAARMLN